MQSCITLVKPDDWHVHFRENEILKYTVNASAKHFARALVMPNLKTPLTTLKSLLQYREEILNISKYKNFIPYMTFYLNDKVNPDDLQSASKNKFILGAKLYPKGATTNSENGAHSIKKLYPLLEIMQEENLVLQIHGEVTYNDIFMREALFISNHLKKIIQNFPKLRIVLEHISTKKAVDFILNAPEQIAATITPHHLMYNRNDLLVGGIKPHYFCLPILKQKRDQNALINAAISGNKKFFAGTDSAPHLQTQKENACGCAGVYSAPIAISMYAEIFNNMDKLDYLENFLSSNGCEFYELPTSTDKISLIKKPFIIPDSFSFGSNTVIPIGAGSSLKWSIDNAPDN